MSDNEKIKEFIERDLIDRLTADKKRQAKNLEDEINRLNKNIEDICIKCIFPEHIKQLQVDLVAANSKIVWLSNKVKRRDKAIRCLRKETLSPDVWNEVEQILGDPSHE